MEGFMVRQHLVTLIVALGVFVASDSAGQALPPGTRTEEDASKAVMMIEFYGTPMKNVIAVIGAGSIGQTVARRVSVGKHVVLAHLRDQCSDRKGRDLAHGANVVTVTRVTDLPD
jgi:lactate dehydrogenase-like 2-hydroxyacid dehydrogenase